MASLEERIIETLKSTKEKGMDRLIGFMKSDDKFFNSTCYGHDHWIHGTPQHSWRVYQYMKFLKENPYEFIRSTKNPPSDNDIRALDLNEIALAGMLHDLGKSDKADNIHGHENRSLYFIIKYLGDEFVNKHPKVCAAIYFHHNKNKKYNRTLENRLKAYSHSTLHTLLTKADGMASGTAWNSTLFLQNKSQRRNESNDVCHLRRAAMDRTQQVLKYRMYLDFHYDFHQFIGYGSKNIGWNCQEDIVKHVKGGNLKSEDLPDNMDYITHAHKLSTDRNKKFCLVVGIETSIIRERVRKLRQNNPDEENLLICSNILHAFYKVAESKRHEYSYCMRDDTIKTCYQNQSLDKGIFLRDVKMFRDGESEGFRMVAPWTVDVLLVPGWRGALVVDSLDN